MSRPRSVTSAWLKPARRLVDQEQAGPGDQRARQLDGLQRAEGQPHHRPVGHALQACTRLTVLENVLVGLHWRQFGGPLNFLMAGVVWLGVRAREREATDEAMRARVLGMIRRRHILSSRLPGGISMPGWPH